MKSSLSLPPEAVEKSLSSHLQLSPWLHSRAGAAFGSQAPRAGCSPTARRWEPKGTWWVTEMETEVEEDEAAEAAAATAGERERDIFDEVGMRGQFRFVSLRYSFRFPSAPIGR